MSNQSTLRRIAAFTLVELLVVIGIIAVLVSILLPALNAVRQQALTIQCSAQLRQVGLAWIQYQNDNKGWVAPMSRHWCDSWANNINYTSQGTNTVKDPSEPEFRWFNYLNRFVKNYNVFNCPMMNAQGGIPSQPGNNTQVKQGNNDGTPARIGRGYSGVGISCNYSYVANAMGRWEIPTAPTAAGLSNVEGNPGWLSAQQKITMGPKRIDQLLSLFKSGGIGSNGGVIAMDGAWWVADNGTTNYDGINYPNRYLHYKQRANALFADGHVDSLLKPQLKGITVQSVFLITTNY